VTAGALIVLRLPEQTSDQVSVPPEPKGAAPIDDPDAASGQSDSHYTDGRLPGDWESKYPDPARWRIRTEARILFVFLVILSMLSGVLLGLSSQTKQFDVWGMAFTIEFRWLTIFAVGCLGGTTFSIKWLIHSVAKGKWHLDRRYWRLFVPMIGGIYACVVMSFLDGGLIGAQAGAPAAVQPRPVALTAALAFLIGYFSDGVSGLLSNVANAVFGTLEKK
jgi:hypothetical protein